MQSSGWHSCFIFRRSYTKILTLRLAVLSFLVVSFCPFMQMLVQYLKLGHGHFLHTLSSSLFTDQPYVWSAQNADTVSSLSCLHCHHIHHRETHLKEKTLIYGIYFKLSQQFNSIKFLGLAAALGF